MTKELAPRHKMSNLFSFVLMTRKEPISSLNSIFLVNLSPCMHISFKLAFGKPYLFLWGHARFKIVHYEQRRFWAHSTYEHFLSLSHKPWASTTENVCKRYNDVPYFTKGSKKIRKTIDIESTSYLWIIN